MFDSPLCISTGTYPRLLILFFPFSVLVHICPSMIPLARRRIRFCLSQAREGTGRERCWKLLGKRGTDCLERCVCGNISAWSGVLVRSSSCMSCPFRDLVFVRGGGGSSLVCTTRGEVEFCQTGSIHQSSYWQEGERNKNDMNLSASERRRRGVDRPAQGGTFVRGV